MEIRLLLILLLPALAAAQQPGPPPPPAPGNPEVSQHPPQQQQPAGGDTRGSQTGLGKSIPFLDPATGTLVWDGYSANITNNPVFRARFEKYLAAPAANSAEDESYRQVIAEILDCLSPTRSGGPDFPKAYSLLKLASKYDIDSGLCDSMSNDIWAVWQSSRNKKNQLLALQEMKNQQRRLAQNNETALDPSRLSSGPKSVNGGANTGSRGSNSRNNQRPNNNTNNSQGNNQNNPQTSSQPTIVQNRGGLQNMSAQDISLNYGRAALYISEIGELESEITIAKGNIAISQITIKVEFQAKIIQYFLSRRYEHVLMACRFYRNMFNDGSSTLEIKEGSDVEKMFSSGLGVAPTIGVLDGAASEAMRDVDESVKSFQLLLARKELTSATEQLGQAFLIGEFMPSVRRLPMEQKTQILQYVRDTNQLIASLEVKDYTLAEELVQKLRETGKDFDYSKPRAAVETAKTVSAMHINAAKVAALNSDNAKVEAELGAAMAIWPTNPAISELSKMLTTTSDIKAQALLDFDRLLSQKDYRQVFMEQGRYAGAVIGDPARQAKLAEVLTIMNEVTIGISAARAASEHGDNWRAYEMVEKLYQTHGDDPEVSRMRSDLTRNVSEFVNALAKAENYEGRDQIGASLTWFLKAKNIYEGSTFATEGIDRILAKLQGGQPAPSSLKPEDDPLAPQPISAQPEPPAQGGPANGMPLTNPNP